MIPLFAGVGLTAYLTFYVALFLHDAWLTNLGKENAGIRFLAPYCLDGCPTYYLQGTSTTKAVINNLFWVALFALQHSGMARQNFKRRWIQFIPPHIERSVYVLAASLSLIMLAAFWEPLPYVWFELPAFIAPVATAVHYLGLAIIIAATFMIDHLQLFGLSQAFSDTAPNVLIGASGTGFGSTTKARHGAVATNIMSGGDTAITHSSDTTTAQSSSAQEPEIIDADTVKKAAAAPVTAHLSRRGFYGYIRHPIIAGTLLAFWSSPCFSTGRLLLNVVITAYCLAAVHYLEEPDLRRQFGEQYKVYQDSVPAFIPNFDANAGSVRRTSVPAARKMEPSVTSAAMSHEASVKG